MYLGFIEIKCLSQVFPLCYTTFFDICKITQTHQCINWISKVPRSNDFFNYRYINCTDTTSGIAFFLSTIPQAWGL